MLTRKRKKTRKGCSNSSRISGISRESTSRRITWPYVCLIFYNKSSLAGIKDSICIENENTLHGSIVWAPYTRMHYLAFETFYTATSILLCKIYEKKGTETFSKYMACILRTRTMQFNATTCTKAFVFIKRFMRFA